MRILFLIVCFFSVLTVAAQPGRPVKDRNPGFSFKLFHAGLPVSIAEMSKNYQLLDIRNERIRNSYDYHNDSYKRRDNQITIATPGFTIKIVHHSDTMVLVLKPYFDTERFFEIDSLSFRAGHYLVEDTEIGYLDFDKSEAAYYNYVLVIVKHLIANKNDFESYPAIVELNRLKQQYGIPSGDYTRKTVSDIKNYHKKAAKKSSVPSQKMEVKKTFVKDTSSLLKTEAPPKPDVITRAYKHCTNDTFCFEKTIHDFGVVMEDQVVSYRFYFKNVSKDTIKNYDARGSGGPAIASVFPAIILPGDEGVVMVQYSSAGQGNAFHKVIRIGFKNKFVMNLYVKGVVVKSDDTTYKKYKKSNYFPITKASLDEADFGEVKEGVTLKKTITISNVGDDTLKIYQYLSAIMNDTTRVKVNLYSSKGTVVTYILPGEFAFLKMEYKPFYMDKNYDELKIVMVTNAPFFRNFPILLKARRKPE